jgi:hypothetical protein
VDIHARVSTQAHLLVIGEDNLPIVDPDQDVSHDSPLGALIPFSSDRQNRILRLVALKALIWGDLAQLAAKGGAMNPLPRETLAELVQTYGPALLDDARRVRALLYDTCPGDRREVGVLVAAVEEGIPLSISRASETISVPGELDRLTTELEDTRGLSYDAARWAVRSWAWVLGMADPPVDQEGGATREPPSEPPAPPPAPPLPPATPAPPTVPLPGRADADAMTRRLPPSPRGPGGSPRRRPRRPLVLAAIAAVLLVPAVLVPVAVATSRRKPPPPATTLNGPTAAPATVTTRRPTAAPATVTPTAQPPPTPTAQPPPTPTAQPPTIPPTHPDCIQGYVWREAIPGDHVCVTPEVRDQAAEDNRLADSRRSPTGGDYGPDTCLQGYVWREAVPSDHVCVTPETRDQAAEDNRLADSRRAG